MRGAAIALAAVSVALAPSAAQAHLVVTGMGPIYDGISHFALTPEDSLPAVALAFFAGLRGPAHARLLLAALPAAWVAGGLIVMLAPAAPAPVLLPALSAVMLLGLGGLLALNPDVSPRMAAMAAVLLGLVRGAADLVGVATSADAALNLVGMAAAVFVLFALAVSITLPLRRFWMIIAARVAGSWLAAAGLLMAGWILRYGARVG
jgi:hypothetical protein